MCSRKKIISVYKNIYDILKRCSVSEKEKKDVAADEKKELLKDLK